LKKRADFGLLKITAVHICSNCVHRSILGADGGVADYKMDYLARCHWTCNCLQADNGRLTVVVQNHDVAVIYKAIACK
jgi:hypothetical protein